MILHGEMPRSNWMPVAGFAYEVEFNLNEATGEGVFQVAPNHRFRVQPRSAEWPRAVKFLEVIKLSEMFPEAGLRGYLTLCEDRRAWWGFPDIGPE